MATKTHTLIGVGIVGALAAAGCSNGTLQALPTAPSSVASTGIPNTTALMEGPFDVLGRGGERGPSAAKRVELSGFVEARGLVGRTLIVHGTVAQVPLTAIIRHGSRTLTFEDIEVGDKVQIKGTVTGATLVATEVKVEQGRGDAETAEDSDDEDDTEADGVRLRGLVAGLEGACPAVTFSLYGASVTTGRTTRYTDVTCLELQDGANVEVRGERQADGSITATRVELVELAE